MASVAAVLLLVAGIAGLVALRRVGFAAPLVLAGVALGAGLLSPRAAGHAVRPLLAPLAFVLLAVPLAVLLDDLGFFEELARRISGTSHVLGASWVLAAGVTALLNLDAAVVMLTPLYLRLAERVGISPLVLCMQPLLLSCLASSALPISNLTNLIAEPAAHLSTLGFLEHLGAPTLAATGAGWWAYLHVVRGRTGIRRSAPPAVVAGAVEGPVDRRSLVLGGVVVIACVAGFLTATSVGGEPYEVAALGDLVLIALTRTVPWRVVPWRSIATVLGLGVLAAALAAHLPVDSLLGGSSLGGVARTSAVLAVGGSVLNNLPALLVTLPHLETHGTWTSWAALLGDNIAPLVLPTGTLASLLWLETVHRLGVDFDERAYVRVAVRVALAGFAAGLATLLLLRIAAGGGQ